VLLQHLRTLPPAYYPEGTVDVFLHEGLIDDAIAAGDHGATHTLVERVVDAAVQSHPEWVIKTARGQAEPLMEAVSRSTMVPRCIGWSGRGMPTAQRDVARNGKPTTKNC
jgi:uncharacterized Zn finger protein